MKSSFVSMLVAYAVSFVTGPAVLHAQDRYKATIPFAFTMGAKAFASGDYSFDRLDEHSFRVRNVKSFDTALTMVMKSDYGKNRPCVIKFHRYGDRYFLSEVAGVSQSWSLHQSAAERSLQASSGRARQSVVVAALRAK